MEVPGRLLEVLGVGGNDLNFGDMVEEAEVEKGDQGGLFQLGGIST